MIHSTKVRQVLSDTAKTQHEEVVQYVVLGGNAGDTLIDMGFFSLAEECRLKYKVVDLEKIDPSGTVIISGGGGLVKEWSVEGTRRVIECLHTRVRKLIILPQTIRGNEDLLAVLEDNVTLFVRERDSYQHALEHCKAGATVLLDHDMAFNLDAKRFLGEGQAQKPRLQNAKDRVRFLFYGVAWARSKLSDEITVRRRDVERPGGRSGLVWMHNDLSFVSTVRGRDPETIANTARLLLQLIDGYKTVRSDRLHVAIGAYLLDKQVTCIDNSNSKVKGGYNFSLSQSPNVRLAND